jgi:hypothetical protein
MATAKRIFPISESEYYRLRDDCCGGVCIACGEIVDEGVEPDAERYECDVCGQKRVYGIEQALLIGRIAIVADSDNPARFENDYPD